MKKIKANNFTKLSIQGYSRARTILSTIKIPSNKLINVTYLFNDYNKKFMFIDHRTILHKKI